MILRRFILSSLCLSTMCSFALAQETFYCETSDGQRTSRIIGGQATSISDFPWAVSLSRRNGGGHKGHFCGASLISKRWILTASHCFFDGSGRFTGSDGIKVHLGDTAAASGKVYGIEKLIVHENYNPKTSENDIALIRLDAPAEGVPAKPVKLASPKLDKVFGRIGICSTVTGWGKTEEGISAPKLKEVSLPIISTQDCQTSYPDERVSNKQVCAAYDVGKRDSCQGDSGGPLVVEIGNTGNYVQVGVVSWGYGCAEKGRPGVYARVSAYIDWILKNTSSQQ